MAAYAQKATKDLWQYGDQGDKVKEIQTLLNNAGYKLDVDGIFGDKTKQAVIGYQQRNGLDVDGIVGSNTWSALTKGSTPTSTTDSAFDYGDFTYGDYQESGAVTEAKNALDTHLSNKPGEYTSQWQSQLDDVINKILNREKFSYDLNGDALYQQYKDKYTNQAKMAMGDAIGQASAMTGGYGNSYAQSVGQQMYQKEMQNLNDIVPELYQMAYDKYNQEGQDMYNQYAMLGDRENMDYGKYADDKSYAYNEYRNAIADEQWQKEFDEAQRQFNEQMAFSKQQYNDSKASYSSGGSSGGGSYSGGSYSGSGSGSGSTGSGSGSTGNGSTGNSKSAGYDTAKTAASKYSGNNDGLMDYLLGQVESGKITEAESDALYAEYYTAEKAALKDRNWELDGGGGTNWFWGIDNNATVKDQYGTIYRLDKLVDALVAEGMSKSDAKAYVKKLQASLGA